tara:strand:- start:2899 stop:3135 length:237 start_codon:yes stop_codon:yes gene_type:complete
MPQTRKFLRLGVAIRPNLWQSAVMSKENTMSLHESIKRKLKDGWTLDRLRKHYDWISEQNFMAVYRSARRDLKEGAVS